MENSPAQTMEEHFLVRHAVWQLLIDALPDLIYVKDPENRYVAVNRAMALFLGASDPAAVVGKTDHAFYPPEIADRLIADEQSVVRNGRPMVDYEELLPCPASGEMCWISTTQVPIHDRRGLIVGLIGIGRNITARKREEEARQAQLARLERQQHTLVTLATHPTVVSGDFEAACRIITELAAETIEVERCSIWSLENPRELRCVSLFERSSGRHSSGMVLQAERYPKYFEAIYAARVIDAHNVLTDTRTDAFSDDYLIPLGITSLLDAPVRLGGQVVGIVCHEHVGPARRWHEDEIVFAGEVADQVAQALLNRRRHEAEEALRRNEERLELALRGANLGMYDWNLRSGEVVINAQYAEMLGYTLEELQPFTIQTWVDLVHPEDRPQEMEALQRQMSADFPLVDTEYRMRTRDGNWKWILDRGKVVEWDRDGKPLRICGTHLDITERKQTEEVHRKLLARAMETQKLNAIGQLTAGIAHEFNNLLTSINGFAELLQMELASDDPRRSKVERILSSGQRAARLVNQLLAFGRKQVIVPRILDLNQMLDSLMSVVRMALRHNIALVTDFEPALWMVKIDPAQVEQIVLNLVFNARDAMPEGGTLTIRTANVILDDKVSPARRLDLESGRYVLLTVEDTGIGMNDYVKQHLFEPFFTTKEVGQGTGLGLAAVFGIVKQNGGDITIESSPGTGTKVYIYLPAVEEASIQDRRPRASEAGQPLRLGTILVFEEHEGVRQLVQAILDQEGYQTLAAASKQEALALAMQYSGEIDLLLTSQPSDVPLSGADSGRAIEALLATCPGMKVLYMTTYADDLQEKEQNAPADVAYILKPFRPSELVLRVRCLLERGVQYSSDDSRTNR
ncbi:MAG: hypothetical protein DDG58_11225 [Ardenticatenia bacterium]|nr:MAG: hypothetical protein DDG58_11225 [Ardenticatenia bacterium]